VTVGELEVEAGGRAVSEVCHDAEPAEGGRRPERGRAVHVRSPHVHADLTTPPRWDGAVEGGVGRRRGREKMVGTCVEQRGRMV